MASQYQRFSDDVMTKANSLVTRMQKWFPDFQAELAEFYENNGRASTPASAYAILLFLTKDGNDEECDLSIENACLFHSRTNFTEEQQQEIKHTLRRFAKYTRAVAKMFDK